MAYLTVNDDGVLVISCEYSEKNVVKDIGARWDTNNQVWLLACTPEKLEVLLDKLGQSVIDGKVEEKIKQEIKKREKLVKFQALAKSDHPVRFKIPGLKLPLYNYQKLGAMFAITNADGTLLADEMGLGKSLQGIAVAMYLKSVGLAENCLVVAPASLKFNWPIEIEKFTDEEYVVIDGSPSNRVAQWLREDVFFHVGNYELVQEDLFGGRKMKEKKDETKEQKERREAIVKKAEARKRILKPIRERKWDLLIVDEAHYLKNPTSARSRNIKRLLARIRIALTGTPLDGRLEELHSIMEFVKPGLMISRPRFMQRHTVTDFWGRVTKYKRKEEVIKQIAPYFLRRLKRDVLKDLPDKVYQNRMVLLTPSERRIYNQLAKRGHKVTENTEAMVAVIRCKQFCDIPSMVDPKVLKASKLEALKEVLEEVVIENKNKALLFSQYAQVAEHLLATLEELKLKYLYLWGETPKKERASMQAQFNDDDSIQVMVGTEAMSLGLNLQAASYVLNYDDNWAPAIMSQREDRAHRHGQKDTVTVVNFVCVNTVEERIRKVLYGKSKVTDEMLGDNTEESVLMRLGPQDLAKLL
jgi:SNF2 family DNA or RNA helicase